MNFKFYFILAIILASFSTVKAQYDENDNYLKGKFQKALISEKNYSVKQVIYSADAKTLATDWRSSGFTLVTKKGTNYFSTGKYVANANITAFGPAITLPKVINGECIILQLDQQFKTETEYDYICVWASTDGGETGSWVYRKSGKSGGAIIDYADLTHLAGKTVQLSLQLFADGTEQSDGWDISNVQLYTAEKSSGTTSFLKSMLKSGGADTTIKIISINSDNYADNIAVNFTVLDADSNFVSGLTLNDFLVYDQDLFRGDCPFLEEKFRLVPRVDIVFLVDNSGSMSDEQAKVAQNINALLDTMVGRYDLQVALYRFGQYPEPICPDYAVGEYKSFNQLFYEIYDSTDVEEFINNAWSANVANGSYEPYYEVLNWASQQALNYRPESQKVFILIGDEPVGGSNSIECDRVTQSSLTQASVAAQLVSEGIQVFAFAKYAYGYQSDYTTIVTQTGGAVADIDANSYADILDLIAQKITGAYTLHYCMPVVNDDSIRVVKLALASNTNINDTMTYRVKDVPSLIRTDATIALSTMSQPRNQSLTIAATLYTDYPDSVISFLACYKQYHEADFTCNVATEVSRGTDSIVFSYSLPAVAVDSPLVFYYFTAIMENQTIIRFSPESAEAYNSWTIPVQPNYPPVIDSIIYNPNLASISPCSPVTVCVHVTDSTINVDEVILYYKINRTLGSFIDSAMTECTSCGNDWYCAIIPAEAATERGLSYYILAKDNYGTQAWWGSPETPLQMEFDNSIDFSGIPSNLRMSVWLTSYLYAEMNCEAILPTDTIWTYFTNSCGDLQKGGYGVWDGATFIVIHAYADVDQTDDEKTGFYNGDTIVFKLERNGFDFPLTFYNDAKVIFTAGGYGMVNAAAAANIPILEITGNNVIITPGSTTTSSSDNTNYGICDTATTHTFSLNNIGCEEMYVTGITTSDAVNFTVENFTQQVIAEGSYYDFDITFNATDDATAIVSVHNNTTTSPYRFIIGGMATDTLSSCTDITLTPNPLAGWGGNASIPISAQCMLTVKVYDIMGNLVSNIFGPSIMSAGVHSIYVNPSGLSSNTTYILTVSRGDETCGFQFSVQ